MVTLCAPDCPDCALRKVPCLECNPVKHFKAISGHIQVHHMNLADYRKKYTQDGTGDDVAVGWTVNARSDPNWVPGVAPADTNEGVKKYDPLSLAKEHLSKYEQKYLADRHTVLFRQVEEDPALISIIRDIVMGEINLIRLQEQQAKLTARFVKSPFRSQEGVTLGAIGRLIKDTQETNLKLLQSMAVTRVEKQKAKKVVESTPSRYVSAYERILGNLSSAQVLRAKQEEDAACERLARKSQEFENLAQPPDADS